MEEKNVTYEDDKIDLLELIHAFWHRLWLILLAGLAGGALTYAFSRYVLIPKYESTALLYVLSKETTLTSLADLQLGSQLTLDYQVLVTSRPVLKEVIDELQLDMTYKELRKIINVENLSDTRFLNITVEDPDPLLAAQIVNKVASIASDYIGDIMEMIPPKLIEDGEVPEKKSSPKNVRNAVLGALAGIMLACGIIAAEVLMNDTLSTEEDVEKYLNMAVLASVPLREGEKKGGRRRKKKETLEEIKVKKKREPVRGDKENG